jgi:hypothetical protein
MTKKDLWAQYVAKNPTFAGDGIITMTASGIRKLFEQTYDRAHDQGLENGKAIQKNSDNRFSDIFKGAGL